MLTIQHATQQQIKIWDTLPTHQAIVFTIQAPELIQFYEDDTAIIIFYGFLDQDTTQANVAEFFSGLLNAQGITALSQCYGAFILIYYVKAEHKYYVANDAMGDFAVHYHHHGNNISLADLPQMLLKKSNCEINTSRLVQYFALTKPHENGSFFAQIQQLNAGHYLTIAANNLSVTRYYCPPLVNTIPTCTLAELAAQFNAIMQQVIAQQSKAHSRVGIMMSGGMDSTFVAANCEKLNKQIFTYSYVFPHMPQADESRWIDAMRGYGFAMHTFAGESYWPLKSPWHSSLNSPISNPYRLLKSVIYQRAQSQSIRCLLTGVFADHLYTGYIYWLVDLLKHKPLAALRALYQTGKNRGITCALRQISPRKFSKKITTTSPWLTKMAQTALQNTEPVKPIKHPHPQQFDLVYGLSTAQSACLENEHSFASGVYLRHPFRDRRVIDFLMALPAWILGDINNPKKFVRYTAQNLLPSSIIDRKKISTLLPLFDLGVLHKELDTVKQILTDPSSDWHHYIQKDLVLKQLKNPQQSHKESELLVLWHCITYELWKNRLTTLA